MDTTLNKLVIIIGPSGIGKNTVMDIVRAHPMFQPHFYSISCTSREPRGKEVDGKDYFFVDEDVFKKDIEENKFLENAYFGGAHYGTLREPVETAFARKEVVFMVIDVQGALAVKKFYENNPTVSIFDVFLLPPSVEVIEQRLRDRGTESEEKIQKRLSVAKWEMDQQKSFTYQVVNDDLQVCVDTIIDTYKKHYNLA